MIFLTVGMSPSFKFDRLVKSFDQIISEINEEVIMQIGCSSYEPKNAIYFRYLPREKIEQYYKNSRIVISHGGIGSIISASHYEKPLIVVPRMKKYGEASDDHQLEITRRFENEKLIVAAYDLKELKKAIKELDLKPLNLVNENKLVSSLKEYIDKI